MSNQPNTPPPNITVEISHESFENFIRYDTDRHIQISTLTDLNEAAQRLYDPNARWSFNITDDTRDFGTHEPSDAERARGDVHLQVRVVGRRVVGDGEDLEMYITRRDANVRLNEPEDRRPTPYFTAERLSGLLRTIGLDELVDDRNCPICQEPFSLDDRPTRLNCGHLVGGKCMERWLLSGHNTCPICRAEVLRSVG